MDVVQRKHSPLKFVELTVSGMNPWGVCIQFNNNSLLPHVIIAELLKFIFHANSYYLCFVVVFINC